MQRHRGGPTANDADARPHSVQVTVMTCACAADTDAVAVTLPPAFNCRNWATVRVTVWSWSDEPRLL